MFEQFIGQIMQQCCLQNSEKKPVIFQTGFFVPAWQACATSLPQK